MALLEVEFPAVKFWRVDEPLTRRLLKMPVVPVTDVPDRLPAVKFVA